MTVIPSAAAGKIIDLLESCGFEAFAVGGCVRDSVLGRAPNDWDVTTSALPGETVKVFADHGEFHVIPTGLKHGTVTVVYGGEPIEITTYRVDGEYADHRRPDSVMFTRSLHEDLARRDFTVNAMAFSHSRGLVDPYGGTADIKAGIIRCVGDPEKRFCEDALRILRALRFASVLEFSIDNATAEAALDLRGLLSHVSAERIFSELSRLLCGKGASRVIRQFLPIISEILPRAEFGGIERICDSMERLGDADAALLYAALLADAPADAVHDTMCALRADNKTRARVAAVCANVKGSAGGEAELRHLCRRIGTDNAYGAVRLGIARGCRSESELAMLDCILLRGDCVSLAELAVGGRELLSLGATPNSIGNILNSLLDDVIDGITENDAAALIRAAKRIIDRKETADK